MDSKQVIKERPIIFSGPMVKAILDGSKTQTRRLVKPGKGVEILGDDGCGVLWDQSPYGKPGDRLWVRETWAAQQRYDDYQPRDIPKNARIWRLADGEPLRDGFPDMAGVNRPSIFMPRWASRITLEVTDVRVERVQDMTAQDACAEGWPGKVLTCCGDGCMYDGVNQRDIVAAIDDMEDDDAVEWFSELWDSINAKTYPWESNPWVWAVSFQKIGGAE